MSLIAIGDLHGCAHTLDAILTELSPQPDDHLVFLGDYIDRGPDSKGVIDRLLELRTQQPCTFLRGNHEALMLDYLDGKDYRLWFVNGGDATIDSYAGRGLDVHIPPEHLDFIRETLLYHDTPDFFFVHAGLKPLLTIEQNLKYEGEHVFLWERDHLFSDRYAWEKTVICGHTPQPRPVVKERLISLDTGCVYFDRPGLGNLTAIRLPERQFVTVRYQG